MDSSSFERRVEMLKRARKGDLRAVEELFSCHQNYLRLLAHTGLSPRVQSRVTVSDVIQETFLHAYEAFAQFRGHTSSEFLVWIRAILASRIADAHEKHLKAARRDVRREVSIDTINDALNRSSVGLEMIAKHHLQRSPGAIVSLQEDAILVADAIGRLPEVYRSVIVLRHFDGLSFDQIAEQLGRSSGAVRMVWLRAIRKLKTVMPGSA